MPTYDYRCNACSHEFEQFQSMKDKPLRKCPKCGKGALERLIGTGGAIIFKGGGFYQTDYRSESYKKSAEAERKPSGAESKSEASAPAAPPVGPKAEGGPERGEGTSGSTKSKRNSDSASDAKPAAKPDTNPAEKSSKGKAGGARGDRSSHGGAAR